MPTTFGKFPERKDGQLKAVHFPVLAMLDEGTREGILSRILHSEGASVRNLPRTIYAQFQQADGHDAAPIVGALYEVTVDEENGVLRDGRGWLADTAEARHLIALNKADALKHNSIDLSEVKGHIDITFDENDEPTIEMHFDEWKLGATTFVGKPAFADAYGEITDDELEAALGDPDEPMVVNLDSVINFTLWPEEEEVTAALTSAPKWEYFHRPEPEHHHKFWVDKADEDGWRPVYGHLALWDVPHDGYDGQAKFVPRPTDNYASFNTPSILTDRGKVEAGPICLYGGHISLAKAMDSVENAWCDVRIVAGQHGPWMCGVVRPHITDEQVYEARASRVSGHWKRGKLKAIMSVNTPGFDVPGFAFHTNDKGQVLELVASYVGDNEPEQAKTPGEILSEMLTGGTWGNGTYVFNVADSAVTTITGGPPPEDQEDTLAFDREKLLAELEADDE